MRRPHRLPRVEIPQTGESYRRPSLVAAGVYVLIGLLVLWQGEAPVETGMAAGDPGLPGGGGGGGGPRMTYITLAPAPSAPAPAAQIEQVPEEILVPVPEVREIRPLTPTPVQPNLKFRPQPLVRRIGNGAGNGGGAGSGSGSGGGSGSGRGTGTGSGTGPGSGGHAGDVFPPTVRYTYLPPLPRPDELQGRTFNVLFTVDVTGRVTDVFVEPQMGDAGYQKKFIAVMRRFRFKPASLADGTQVTGQTVLSFTL